MNSKIQNILQLRSPRFQQKLKNDYFGKSAFGLFNCNSEFMDFRGRYFSIIILLFISFTLQAQLPKVKKVYPKGVPKKVKMGMSLSDFKARFKDAKPAEEEYDFREVYLLEAVHSEITSFVLYFDADGNKPLYEIMVVYRDNQLAKRSANTLFGDPNYEEKEWKVLRKKQIFWSWVYQEKLILVANIPDTEWSDSF
ncbi:MAG: hypothetical protein AAFQ94_12945 [Bacteroidota bacterium]